MVGSACSVEFGKWAGVAVEEESEVEDTMKRLGCRDTEDIDD